jgi:hypothetical protein
MKTISFEKFAEELMADEKVRREYIKILRAENTRLRRVFIAARHVANSLDYLEDGDVACYDSSALYELEDAVGVFEGDEHEEEEE